MSDGDVKSLELQIRLMHESINRRFEESKARGDERHIENVERLEALNEKADRIETQAIRTNGRVDAHDRWLQRMETAMKEKVSGVTLGDVTRWIAIVVGTVLVLQFMGKLNP